MTTATRRSALNTANFGRAASVLTVALLVTACSDTSSDAAGSGGAGTGGTTSGGGAAGSGAGGSSSGGAPGGSGGSAGGGGTAGSGGGPAKPQCSAVSIDEDVFTGSAPCGFDLSATAAGETVSLDCIADLEGATVKLPANVALEFAGGDIVNGTLEFGADGIIDGRLLNSSLNLSGDAKLKDTTFEFHPKRWDVVEGPTDSDTALANNTNLETLMNRTKDLGAETFLIDRFDAYFEVTRVTSTTSNQNFYPRVEALNVPGDFHLRMTDRTFLRVQPNSNGSGALLAVYDTSGSRVTCGNLVGDRDEHVYPDPSLEDQQGQHLLLIRSGKQVVIDGVNLTMGSAGGIDINSDGFSFQPEYNPTDDVVIKNCSFSDIRRMSLAITDGRNITVDSNSFSNTNLDRPKSVSGEVGYAINIEALRDRDPQGELRYYQKAFDINIRNNVEKGSKWGSLTISIGERVFVENNQFEGKVVYTLTNGTRIRNNTFVASAETAKSAALLVGGPGETVFDNEASGNTITGYGVGINGGDHSVKVFDNVITDCGTGIQLKNAWDMEFYNNKITSSDPSSKAFFLHVTSLDDIVIRNNESNVGRSHIEAVQLNQATEDAANRVVIRDNQFLSDAGVTLSSARGVVFENNVTSGSMQLINASQIDVLTNTFSPTGSHGIRLRDTNTAVQLDGNAITVGAAFDCIDDQSDSQSSVTIGTNTCTKP